MGKSSLLPLLLTIALGSVSVNGQLEPPSCYMPDLGGKSDNVPGPLRTLRDMTEKDIDYICYTKLGHQIGVELNASMTYLAMGAHFSRDVNYRPGMAKFMLDSAIEEREHAKKMIDYLLMRGIDVTAPPKSEGGTEIPFGTLIPNNIGPEGGKVEWKDMEDAIQDALNLERFVTAKIKGIIETCEGTNYKKVANDYHAVDYLTGEFLTEQHESIRILSGHLATLHRLKNGYGSLAELIFDKTLVQEEQP